MAERTNFVAVRTVVALALATVLSLVIYRQATIDRGDEFYKPNEIAAVGRGSPAYLTMAAEQKLTDGDPGTALSLARRALTLTPASPAALRIFALASASLGNRSLAGRVMSLAGLWGWRDPDTQLWLMTEAGKYGDLTNMLIHADALLRTEGATDRVLALITATLGAPGGIGLVAARLADGPNWRQAFFNHVARSDLAAAPMMVSLAVAMRSTSPVTAGEIAPVVNALVDRGQERAAGAIWRQAFAARFYAPGNAVFDPGFEYFTGEPAAAVATFDWQVLRAPGLDIGVRAAPAKGGKALSIHYNGEEGVALMRQSLLLAPGDYRLRVGMLRDSAAAPLRWTISCPGKRLDLVGRPVPGSGQWLTESYRFTVPPGCGLQKLELDSASSAGLAEGTTWIDDVSVGS